MIALSTSFKRSAALAPLQPGGRLAIFDDELNFFVSNFFIL